MGKVPVASNASAPRQLFRTDLPDRITRSTGNRQNSGFGKLSREILALEKVGENNKVSASGVEPDSVLLGELQLILAEKRTALSVLRTGIAVFVLPLSVLSLLIATSKQYEIVDVIHLFAPILAICLALVILGTYLIVHSLRRMRRYDGLINRMKSKHSRVSQFLD